MTDRNYTHLMKTGAPGAPLLVTLHGTGGDENQFFTFASQLRPDATILSPRGDISEHGAARFFRRTGEGVYDMADLARGTQKLAAFVREKAEAVGASEIFGLGFSNGANILANMLVEAPDLFDRAALLHPLIPFQPAPAPGLAGRRILVTAGERDPICPTPLTIALADYFTAQGATTQLSWHNGGHDIRDNEIEAMRALFA
ncbi:esterase [Rhizobium sp. Leaf371]|uniref:alpha/beta hydrolase n=1 Tax=Rhizobium sp. Leaf371 TaxID=1736355 RepID=UPI000712BC7D|nr:alpha/beta hydrolase [Rhizobium sp. Leaf371]KQS65353.1 esterase [Rhizobium sp. Leaf371]